MSSTSNGTAAINRGSAIPVIVSLVVFGIMFRPGFDNQESLADCKKTVSNGKCGTDTVLSHTVCETGQQVCNLLEWTFGDLQTCASSGSGGLDSCAAGQCQKTVITRECQGNVCKFLSAESSNVQPISMASGAACGNPTPGPVANPLDDDPPAIQPGPTSGGGG
jgi:hypothetical protein